MTEAIAHELAAERLNLLETLAERIAERILLEPQALRAFVRIEKLDRGPGALGVEIVRTARLRPVILGGGRQMAQERRIRASSTWKPAIADAAPAAAGSTRSNQRGAPLILCVGAPDGRRRRPATG